jgi:glycosyltransferase involved in cell wall biosynthesis
MDVFVLASLMEGTSLALMEAMASGTPCVATAVGGTPEIITDGESGLLVPPGDTSALVHSVLELLENGALRASIARKAQERVRRDYDVQKRIDTILSDCEQLLAKSSRKAAS